MPGQLSTNVKETLLWKLINAVCCSVLSQVVYLMVFLFTMNFSVLQPITWLKLTISTMVSLNTWLFLVPLSAIIFAQGVICSKDYVYESPYKTTRFLKMLSIFSMRNLFMVMLHAMTGGLIVWLYLTLLGGKYGAIYRSCEGFRSCFVEEYFFMLLNGMWIGLFYFLKTNYSQEVNIIFPVIQQRKFLTVKSNMLTKLRQAANEAIWPTLYFIILYYYKGVQLREWITYNSGLSLEKDPIDIFDFVNSPLLLFSWLFSTLFIYTILCMRLYFEVFLTEQWMFPIESESPHILTLKEAVSMNDFPIIQHLACLDFYNLAIWDMTRRQQLFTLSQPGGHPHNWNQILEEVLKLITDFSSNLNKATDAILSPECVEKPIEELEKSEFLPRSPLFPTSTETILKSPPMYSPIRNMALPIQEPVNIVEVRYNKFLLDAKDLIRSLTVDKFNNLVSAAKKKLGVQYLFGEVPESRIYFLLSKGQPVIWAVQGLSFLVSASFEEDKYGVVQKDIPVIATSLVTLKQNLDKLNKVSFVNRKTLQGETLRIQLKNSLRTAVRRSLYNICNTFGPFLTQIPLNKDVHQQLISFMNYREG